MKKLKVLDRSKRLVEEEEEDAEGTWVDFGFGLKKDVTLRRKRKRSMSTPDPCRKGMKAVGNENGRYFVLEEDL